MYQAQLAITMLDVSQLFLFIVITFILVVGYEKLGLRLTLRPQTFFASAILRFFSIHFGSAQRGKPL